MAGWGGYPATRGFPRRSECHAGGPLVCKGLDPDGVWKWGVPQKYGYFTGKNDANPVDFGYKTGELEWFANHTGEISRKSTSRESECDNDIMGFWQPYIWINSKASKDLTLRRHLRMVRIGTTIDWPSLSGWWISFFTVSWCTVFV